MKTLFILFFVCVFPVLAVNMSKTVSVITEGGEFSEIEFSDSREYPVLPPLTDAPEIVWHYSLMTGEQQKMCPMGQGSAFVFTGGWYGGAQMFAGTGGSGTYLWTVEPEVGPNEYWTSLATGTAAAKTADLFYAVQLWNVYNDNGTPGYTSDDYLVSENNTSVQLFSSSSSAPIWTYSGGGVFITSSGTDTPGTIACSDDGLVCSVAGEIGGHLAIQFFTGSSAVPVATYEDTTITYYPRQLRLTADGSKCIFRVSATLYRVDTATGTLEASFPLDASNDCFAISPDGSVVAYGFTAARIALWDGSGYSVVAGKAVPGYYGGAAAISADNQTVFFGFYKNTYKTNKILRFDVSSSTPLWIYDYPTGSGSNQDVLKWMDCSDDGRWLVAASWGCSTGGGDEVEVFDDENPTAPVFSIDTPGSMFHVDMSSDGRYLTATGKHVHANVMGSGTDTYFVDMGELGIWSDSHENSFSAMRITPNPATSRFNLNFKLSSSEAVSISIHDLSGRTVWSLPETHMSTGEHNISVETDLSTGVYFCRLSHCGESLTEKLVVVR